MPSGQYRVVRKQTDISRQGGSQQAVATVAKASIEGARRFVTAISVKISSQVAIAVATYFQAILAVGSPANFQTTQQWYFDVPAAVIPSYDYTLTDIAIEVSTQDNTVLMSSGGLAGLLIVMAITIEDRIYD